MSEDSGSDKLAAAGLKFTKVYLIFLFGGLPVGALFGIVEFHQLKLNEIGDFLAGALGPLAILWVVLGFFQQSVELARSTEAVKLQASELSKSAEQQAKLEKATRESVEQRQNERRLESKRAFLKIYSDVSRTLQQLPLELKHADRSRLAVISATGMRQSGAHKKWSSTVKNYETEIEHCFSVVDSINLSEHDFGDTKSNTEAEIELYDVRNRLYRVQEFVKHSLLQDDRERDHIKEDNRHRRGVP